MKRILVSLSVLSLTSLILFSQSVSNSAIYDKYYRCVYWDNQNKAKKLIEKGLSVDSRDASGKTILMYCLKNNELEFANFFIDAGANPNLADSDGNTSLHYAIENCPDYKIVYKLIEKGANVEAVNNQNYSPFHFSILFACPELPFYLIGKGVNYKRITALNENALHLSLEAGCDSLTSYLLRQNINLYLQDNNGFTPLLKALCFRKTEFALRLMDLGADVNTSDNENNSCLFYALTNEDTLSFRGLVEHGATIDQGKGPSDLMALAADLENEFFIKELLIRGASDSLACNTDDEHYKVALLFSVKSEIASDDSTRILLLEKSIELFSEARSLYKKRENELYAVYSGEVIYDLFALGTAVITGYYPTTSNSSATEMELNYCKKRAKICISQIERLNTELNMLEEKTKPAGTDSMEKKTIEL